MENEELTPSEHQISDDEFEQKLAEMIRLGQENMEYGNNPDFRALVDEWIEELQNFKAARHAGAIQILFETEKESEEGED